MTQVIRSSGDTGTLLRGTASAFLVNVLGMGIAFLCHFVLARVMGAGQYGTFAFASSWVHLCVLFAVVGLDTSLVRFIPQYRVTGNWEALRGIRRRAFQIVVVAAVGVGAGMALVATLVGRNSDSTLTLTFWIAATTLPLLAAALVTKAALRGLRKVGFCEAPLTIVRPIVLAGGVLVIHILWRGSANAAVAMAVNGVALIAALFVGGIWLRRAMPELSRAARPVYETRQWLRVSAPMFLVSGMRTLLHEIDVILIGVVLGTAEAGVYAIAARLAALMTFSLTASNAIAGPLISELYTQGKHERLQATTRRAATIAFSGALSIGGILVVGRFFALGMFGSAFEAGAGVLLILALGQLVNAATGPVGILLNMTGHHDANARIFMVITVLNVAGTYPAIRLWGMEGAAVVTSSLIAVKNLWTWYEVRRRLGVDSSPLRLGLRKRGSMLGA